MANPSSSHHDRDRDRERVRERSHHHHRTISSTTLLLTLSLILAVLAVMLSLPSNRGSVVSTAHSAEGASHQPSSFWNILTPRRTDTLVAREVAVAKRESDVARREAEILAGALVSCGPPYATVTEHIENFAPAQTIYKEIIKEREVPSPTEAALSAPVTADLTRRIEDLISRETKVAEREKDMSRREEIVNRREHDASRRENWIMEQLIALGNDPQTIEEEYIYEPTGAKRKLKVPLPTSTILSVTTETVTSIATPPPPPPANTRHAAFPAPQSYADPTSPISIPTKVVEVVLDDVPEPEPVDEIEEEERVERLTYRRKVPPPPRSRQWVGSW